jgi:3-hydroxyisobutyrate dehydrogenase-like beta-hydroxyacid dehydrogenase
MSLTLGVVSPGAMGSALGRVWAAGGSRVVATTAGRSPRTAQLAHGLELLSGLDDVVRVADVVVTVVPPDRAVQVATEVAAACARVGASPLVADLNAISPSTVALVADALGGLELLDGSISGPPPTPGSTTVYLSGPSAALLADLPAPGLDVQVVGPHLGTASAVKMCTASVYKGTSALMLQALRTAAAHGVVDVVLADLGRDPAESAVRMAMGVSKSDRYPGEMREIALTQGDAGGRPELFEAMALVWESVRGTSLAALTPEQAADLTDLTEVLRRLG